MNPFDCQRVEYDELMNMFACQRVACNWTVENSCDRAVCMKYWR